MITVGIAAYNQAEYLPEAIESALNQTLPAEIIVVIDGATDSSEEIARKYPVRVVSQVNKGLASARNAAIMNSSGNYFLPLDSDDRLASNAVEKIEQKIIETDADVIGLSVQTFGTSDEQTILHPTPGVEEFKKGNHLPYCSAIRREALLECGGYSPRYDALGGWEDYALWHDMLSRKKKIVTIPEPLFFYRTKDDSMWQRTKGKEASFRAQLARDYPFMYA